MRKIIFFLFIPLLFIGCKAKQISVCKDTSIYGLIRSSHPKGIKFKDLKHANLLTETNTDTCFYQEGEIGSWSNEVFSFKELYSFNSPMKNIKIFGCNITNLRYYDCGHRYYAIVYVNSKNFLLYKKSDGKNEKIYKRLLKIVSQNDEKSKELADWKNGIIRGYFCL